MSKVKTLKLLHLVIICLCTSLLFTSCKYQASDEQRIEIVSSIAEIVNENYRNENAEKPLYISMNEIDNLADTESDLHKAFEKYEDVQGYDVYLVDDHMIVIFTNVLYQQRTGYVVSDEELQDVLTIPGIGCDGDRITITGRINNSNLYTFSAGQ